MNMDVSLISMLLILCIITYTTQSPYSFYSSKSFLLSLPSSFTFTPLKETLQQGEYTSFTLTTNNTDFSLHRNIKFTSSNTSVAIVHSNSILAINPGDTTITASLHDHPLSSFKLTIVSPTIPTDDEKHIKKAEEILETLTLQQKIGQMFAVGFDGTIMDDTLIQSIEQYKFGNMIYMQANVEDYPTLANLTNTIQSKIINETGVPGFISIDQEGGNVVRLFKGGTHFLGAMAMGATFNSSNSHELGIAMGKELLNYGINTDYTPSLDVNNNPYNPIIGIRSYSDDPITVAKYGNEMYSGLNKSGVMGCVKHFPGHGNTNVDSHIGLPMINATMEELYQIELAPFISAFSKGIDALMTTHIIFSTIDDKYPATLSDKVITNLLRGTLGYQGVIFTDGMEMGAVTSAYGGYDETALLAIKAGVDILLYTTNKENPRIAYQAVLAAVENKTISEDRINESVKRILIKKSKFGILDNWKAKDEDITQMLKDNGELNQKFAEESLTLVKGDFAKLDKTKPTLIISPKKTNVVLDPDLTTNSFAEYASKYLKDKGKIRVCDYLTVDKNMSDTEATNVLNNATEYQQLVIALQNVQTNNYTYTAQFVNSVLNLNKEVIIIALETPYDLMIYNKTQVKTYICTYNYQRATMIALTKFLNGEIIAKGKLPIDESVFQ